MDIPTPPQTLEENKLNDLGDTMNDSEPEEDDGIPKANTDIPETPSPQEFAELNYKGFNFKVGSCRLIASQLAELSYNIFNLVTKGGVPDEQTKSYLS